MKKLATAIALAFVAGAASASAITYKTGAGFESDKDSATYEQDVSTLVGKSPIETLASFNDASFGLSNSAFETTITFDVTSPTTYDFRAGVDFGGGGTMILDGTTALATNGNNMWWNNSYSDTTQFLAGTANLSVGVHTLTLYGFEDCCSGNMQVQFSTDKGNSFTSFASNDGLPAVPEAQNVAMLLAGLGLVGTLARRRKQA